MPEVSVVIPLYNKGPHIGRAVNCVLTQTIQDFEVIVIDGDSTDEGPSVVNKITDPRVRFHVQETRGVSAARNEGVEIANSEFIAFLDADDEWDEDHLETLLRLRTSFPRAGAYTTAYSIKSHGSETRLANFVNIPPEPWEGLLPGYFNSAARGDSPVWTSAVAIPKRIFEEMGGFNTHEWWGEDTDLWCRIALKYPVSFSWTGKGIYHTEATNRISNRDERVKQNIVVTTARNALRDGEVRLDQIEDLCEYIARKEIETAYRNLEIGRPDLARKNLKNCQTRHLQKTKYWLLFWANMPSWIFLKLHRMKSGIIDTT